MRVRKYKFDGVYMVNDKYLATENLVPGQVVYGEKIFRIKGKEYREWNPRRSKLAAAILKGLREFPIKKGIKILYLGVASGTTASHISDIIGWEGIIYGVDISPRVLRKTIIISEKRKNIIPILADASFPERYSHIVSGKVDLIYEDVAQKHQIDILERNAEFYLKDKGYAFIAVKARSIDSTKSPKIIFKMVEEKLKENFKIIDKRRLEPYERDHMMYLLRY